MDPTSATWIFAQFVKWAKSYGGPYKVYRIVMGRKWLILIIVIESLAILGIGTYEFIKNREKIASWCERKLKKVKVTQADIDEANQIISLLEK